MKRATCNIDDAEMLRRIRVILPNYDSLPNLLNTVEAAAVIGLQPSTLETDRVKGKTLGLGFIKLGVKVVYPKIELGKYLVRNSHDIFSEASNGNK